MCRPVSEGLHNYNINYLFFNFLFSFGGGVTLGGLTGGAMSLKPEFSVVAPGTKYCCRWDRELPANKRAFLLAPLSVELRTTQPEACFFMPLTSPSYVWALTMPLFFTMISIWVLRSEKKCLNNLLQMA